MSALHYLFFFLLAIGILIVVHEYGHYAAARLCGVKVLRFSLGFGPQLLMKRFGVDRTEWTLAVVPLGGYVKMLDEREAPVDQGERHRAFNTQSLFKRSLIVLAGPVANLLLAVLIYWGLACAGTRDFPSVLGKVDINSIAASAGLEEGDRVLRFAGKEVRSWGELKWQVVDHALDGETVLIDVERKGFELVGLALSMQGLQIDEKAADPLKQLGLSLPSVRIAPVLGVPLPGSPAERAGLRNGDRIRSVNGQAVEYWHEFVAIVAASPGKELPLRIERAGQSLELTVRPEVVTGSPGRGRVGVPVRTDEAFEANNTVNVSYDLLDGAWQGISQTWSTSWFSLKVMWHILKGEVSLRNVSGPVTIADYAGQSAYAGFSAYVRFLAMVSISLGVLNLLPIPILDGGHLLYYVLECLRGKAVSERIEELGQRIGMAILALLMSLAFFNDFHRVFFG